MKKLLLAGLLLLPPWYSPASGYDKRTDGIICLGVSLFVAGLYIDMAQKKPLAEKIEVPVYLSAGFFSILFAESIVKGFDSLRS